LADKGTSKLQKRPVGIKVAEQTFEKLHKVGRKVTIENTVFEGF
jgi:hypothetical protein